MIATIFMIIVSLALLPIAIPMLIVFAVYVWLAAYIILGGIIMVIKVVVKGVVAYLMDALGIIWDLKEVYAIMIVLIVIGYFVGG